MTSIRQVNGEDVLYHYLQKDLLVNDVWLFQMLTARLVASLGIWLDPKYYKRIPILLPFARRDSSCRKSCNKKGIEEWGSPDSNGYFRDDNSLIKNMPKSLSIESPLKDIYNNQRIGRGFVACHVWRLTTNNIKKFTFKTCCQKPTNLFFYSKFSVLA